VGTVFFTKGPAASYLKDHQATACVTDTHQPITGTLYWKNQKLAELILQNGIFRSQLPLALNGAANIREKENELRAKKNRLPRAKSFKNDFTNYDRRL
jgi:hypothetical protein